MSGFEEENPFADPSVQKAVAGTQPANLDDYNPFDKNNPSVSGGSSAPPQNSAAPPPTYESTRPPQISAEDFERRQEELERRAQELERREAELRNAPTNVRQNNWPPLPSFCPVQPCFYQDINVDVPVEFQKIVRNLYYLWIAHASLLLANFIVALFYMFTGASGSISTFGLALLYTFLFTPSSFVCWFRPAYKAFRDDSSLYFMVFFFVFFFQFLMSMIYCFGIGGMGSCGLALGIHAVGQSGGEMFVGILMIIVGVGFGLSAMADFYMLVKIHKLYRTTGASMAKAQAEFTTGVMKNETVRNAAAEAAREGVRSQMGSAFGSTSNGGGPQQGNGTGNRF